MPRHNLRATGPELSALASPRLRGAPRHKRTQTCLGPILKRPMRCRKDIDCPAPFTTHRSTMGLNDLVWGRANPLEVISKPSPEDGVADAEALSPGLCSPHDHT